MDILKEWSDYFDSNDIHHTQKKLLLEYIDKLVVNNVPIIFEFKHLSELLGFDIEVLAETTINTDYSYRKFQIPKKKGGSRTITSPYPALAHAQKWVYDNILKEIDIGEHSYAFCKDRNILENARVHLHSKELLKMDVVDFFGSIRIERVISVFKNLGYSNLLSFHLASICCYKKSLPQGACTSPVLSNIIAKRLDKRLYGLAVKLNLNYSRYADDIALSGDLVPTNLKKIIEKILNDEGFKVNKRKTVLIKNKRQRKIVTGLLVSGDEVRVTKPYRRKFRQDLHYLLMNNVDEFNGRKGKFDPLYIDRMIGRANFILSVEPTNNYVSDGLKKLKELKIVINHPQKTIIM